MCLYKSLPPLFPTLVQLIWLQRVESRQAEVSKIWMMDLSLSPEDNLKGILDQLRKLHLNLPHKIKQAHTNRQAKFVLGR